MKHKQQRKLVALVMLVMFIMSTATPVWASGLADISSIGSYNDMDPTYYDRSDTTIYFGNYWQTSTTTTGPKDAIQWRVIKTDAANNKTLLLSDKLLYKDTWGEVLITETDKAAKTWKDSTVRKNLTGGYADTPTESSVVNYDALAEGSFAKEALSKPEYDALVATEAIFLDNRTIDKLFVLTTTDAKGYNFDSVKRKGSNTNYSANQTGSPVGDYMWWVRDNEVTTTDIHWAYVAGGIITTYREPDKILVRPSVNLDWDSVLFLSAAEATKSDGTNYDKNSKKEVNVGDGFALADYDGSKGWKLTLKDTTITAPTVSNINAKQYNVNDEVSDSTLTLDGGEQKSPLEVKFSAGLPTDDNEYISALLYSGDGSDLLNYAKVVGKGSSTDVDHHILTDGLATGSYRVKFFKEQVSDNYLTDYASNFAVLSLVGGTDDYYDINVTNTIITALGKDKATGNLSATLKNGARLDFFGTSLNGFDGIYNTNITIEDQTDWSYGQEIWTDVTVGSSGATEGVGSGNTTLSGNFNLNKMTALDRNNAYLVLHGNLILTGGDDDNPNKIYGVIAPYGGLQSNASITIAGGVTELFNANEVANGTIATELNLTGGKLTLDASTYGTSDGSGNFYNYLTDFTGGTLVLSGGNGHSLDSGDTINAMGDTEVIVESGIVMGGTINQTVDNSNVGTVKFEGSSIQANAASFGASGKISGGNVELGQNVAFKASNLDADGAGIVNLTAPTAENKNAIYNFKMTLQNDTNPFASYDQIKLSGVATGHITLGSVELGGVDVSTSNWDLYTYKLVPFLSNASMENTIGHTIEVDNTLSVVMPGSDGASYIFSQGCELNDDGTLKAGGNKLFGYLKVQSGNTYTLWEAVGSGVWEDDTKQQDTPMTLDEAKEARSVDIYTLQTSAEDTSSYVAGKNFTALTRADSGTPRTFTIAGLGNIAFKGGNHTGIAVNSGDTLNIDGVKEISGWENKIAFTNAGTLNFTGSNPLTLYDGIVNNAGGEVTFSQDTILDFAENDTTGKLSGAGTYTNEAEMTVKKLAKLAMTGTNGLTNTGIVNLAEDGGTLGVKISGGTINITENVSANASYIAGDTNLVKAEKALTLTGTGDAGILSNAISGTGNIYIGKSGSGGAFGDDAVITSNASNFANTGTLSVRQNNTLILTGTGDTGILSHAISGAGTVEIAGDDVTSSASNFADTDTSLKVNSTGKLTLTTGELKANLTNSGGTVTFAQDNTVTLNSTLSGTGTYTNEGTLNVANAANLGEIILANNIGTVNLTGEGELKAQITGTGSQTNIGDGASKAVVTVKESGSIAGDIDILAKGELLVENNTPLTNPDVNNKGVLKANFTSGYLVNDGIWHPVFDNTSHTSNNGGNSFALLLDENGIINMNDWDWQGVARDFRTLNITVGDNGFNAQGGTFVINTDLAEVDGKGTGDVINLTGNVAGNASVMVAYDPTVVEKKQSVEGDHTFLKLSTANRRIQITAKSYNYAFGGKNVSIDPRVEESIDSVGLQSWKITSIGNVVKVGEITKAVSDSAQVMGLAWLNSVNNLQKRLGDLRGGEESNMGWVRFQRSLDDLNNGRKLNMSGNLYQIGYDFALKGDKDSRDYLGLSLERFDGTQSFGIGGGDVKSTTLGAYYTKIYNSGHYFDFILRYGRYESDTTSCDASVINPEVTKLDYDVNGFTLSGEYGYRANIGDKGLYFEPQAEFIYGYLTDVNKTSSTGLLAHISSTNHFITRFGVALGQKVKNFNYYLRTSYYHDFAGKTSITYDNTPYEQDGAQNWWEVSLGGGWNLSDTSYFYAELTKHFKDVSNSLNFNLGFRFTL